MDLLFFPIDQRLKCPQRDVSILGGVRSMNLLPLFLQFDLVQDNPKSRLVVILDHLFEKEIHSTNYKKQIYLAYFWNVFLWI